MADSTDAIVAQVNDARATGATLQITGSGSKHFMGRQVSADATVDLGQHRGIVNYQPVELVLTARAGTPLEDIEAALAEHGQTLAFDPPRFANSGTLGGTLACNQSGPSRPWSGSVRDAVLGIRLVNGLGEELRFGGEVMKNVAGYDLSRTQAGAMGTLGVITEISLKVMPVPATCLTLVQEMPAERAIHTMNERAGLARPLGGACWLAGRLYLRLCGPRSAVEETARHWGGEILRQENAFWRSLRDHELEFFAGDATLWRFSVNPTAPALMPEAEWLIDWGGAQRWLRGDYPRPDLHRAAARAGGELTLFRGGDRTGEVYASPQPPVKQLHQRLKAAFDPHGLFNPGRLYGWL